MALSILVRLRSGRYDAGGERSSQGEWPPHPARIFCALAASATGDSDWAALQWLEQQALPQVWADAVSQVHTSQAHAYVVQNAIEKDGGNLTWPGRNNGLRIRASAVPSGDSFAIVWPQAESPADVLNCLNLLAWKVPYVGRSTSTAQVSAIGTLPPEMPGTLIYEPAEFGTRGQSWDLRIPYQGYTDALRRAYADGRRSWEVARTRRYRTVQRGQKAAGTADVAETATGPFSDLMVWGIVRPVARIGGDLVVSLADALRKAVLSRVPDPVPGQISGHTNPGRPHVAFLVLPDVGHAHADGHALGLALALPDDLPAGDLTSLLRAVLLEPALEEIRFASGRPLAISYGADRASLRPSRWTAAGRGGEREWVTATPVMLDGHLRSGRDEASEVARSLVIAGYPEPVDVESSTAPMVAGGVWRPRQGTIPSGRPRRQLVHARVRFDQPVVGPVLAGSMRYLGLGLFVPAIPHQSRQSSARAANRPDSLSAPDGAGDRELAEVPR